MIIHRPHRGSLDNAMSEAREFASLKECLNTLIEEFNYSFGHIFNISIEDLCIEFYSDKDSRIDWYDVFIICIKPYKDV